MTQYNKKDPFAEREASLYKNPIPSREFIMQYLDELGYPASQKQIAKAFDLKTSEQLEGMRRRLIAMLRDGQLIKNRRGKYALVKDLELVCGQVSIQGDGYGLVFPDGKGDPIFLPYRHTRQLFNGDRVLVQITGGGRPNRPEGALVEVVERAVTQHLIGRLHKEKGMTFVVPDGKQSHQEIMIPHDKIANATAGAFVKVNMTSYPEKRRPATGEVIEVLGDDIRRSGLAIQLALYTHQLPFEWSEEVLSEMAHFPTTVKKLDSSQRQDLRDKCFVTIDGADAKDFDDAVYCEPLPEGEWQLWVAIADVSHYVKPDTALDQAAYRRGNSVYFPNNVIPMLPDVLSNHLCSLKPKVDRLSLVCEMTISKKGHLKAYTFYRAVIHSKARLTYNQVALALGEGEAEKKEKLTEANQKKIAPLLPHLQHLKGLHQVLATARQQRGALFFKTIATQISFDSKGKIKAISPSIYNKAHQIIEECMLMANVAAARFLDQHKIPTLYRVHEGISENKLADLRCFLNELGLKLAGGDQPSPKDYVHLLKKVEGRPDESLIHMALLRSMKQAIYLPKSDPHFGLAFDKYCHFTSPIRRYPDLIVHRAIGHLLDGKHFESYRYTKEFLLRCGQHCSMTERRADEAVRDVESWLKCEYMKDKLGQSFEGVITHVTHFGVFVMLNDIYVEGLVHITSLYRDYYHYDPVHHRLIGKRSSTTYRLGDKLKVIVARVSIEDRQIDFELD